MINVQISKKVFNDKYAISLFKETKGAFLMLGLLVAGISAIKLGAENRAAAKAKAAALEAKKQAAQAAAKE